MPVFYLEPAEGKVADPSWEASSLKEGCWTEADTETIARDQVKSATFTMIPEQHRDSPWVQPQLAKCRVDNSPRQIPSGMILSKTGKLIDIPVGQSTT
jgi:hypothetical protein